MEEGGIGDHTEMPWSCTAHKIARLLWHFQKFASTYLYLYVFKYINTFFFFLKGGGGSTYLRHLPTQKVYKYLLSFKVVAQNAVRSFDIYTQLCQICQDVFMPKC